MITIQRGLKSAVSRPSATFAGPLRVSASRASPRIFPSAARLQNLHVSSRQTFSQRWWSRYAPRRTLRNNSSSPRPNTTEHLNSPPAKLSLKDQLKRLTKEYGRGAILVYLLFSVADLPVAFGIVRLFGPERVGAAEHAVLEQIKSLWHAVAGPITGQAAEAQTVSATSDIETATVREGIVGEEATHVAAKARDGDATIWTQLALAYAIHKTLFIFVRIPLTVAFTPGIVKWMRRRGGFLAWVVGPKPVPSVK